jgi:predicted nucleic acid-binding Zn ribbon protein
MSALFDTRILRYECPACSRKLRPVMSMNSATQVIRQTCPACRKRWQLVITPHERAGNWFDVCTFAEVSGVQA